MDGLLVGFKQETDRDLHVVIADPDNLSKTMIVEIPDSQCSTVIEGGHGAQIAKVRQQFIACFGAPKSGFVRFKDKMIARIRGVGFLEFIHGTPQVGVARNAIEIDPVLGILTLSGSCPTGYSAHIDTTAIH